MSDRNVIKIRIPKGSRFPTDPGPFGILFYALGRVHLCLLHPYPLTSPFFISPSDFNVARYWVGVMPYSFWKDFKKLL